MVTNVVFSLLAERELMATGIPHKFIPHRPCVRLTLGPDGREDIVKIWYDAEGDYVEVLFDRKEATFRNRQRPSDGKGDAEGKLSSIFIKYSRLLSHRQPRVRVDRA